jgi:ferredoxin
MKPGTKKLAKFHRGRFLDFIHSYIYYKWTSAYIRPIKYVLEHPKRFPKRFYRKSGERLMQAHHAKVITHETAKQLIDVKKPIEVHNSEQVLPFEKARDIVLSNSDHIAVIDCPCRKLQKYPCEPIDVCFVLGEPFVEFVVEQKKDEARRLDVKEALEILEREHLSGRVHTAWFKDVAGDRLYSICNCCSCCCMGFQALAHGFGLVSSSGYVAQIDSDLCAECGVCSIVCPFRAIKVNDHVEVDTEKCKGCGVCLQACPNDAIKLVEDKEKPGPIVLP